VHTHARTKKENIYHSTHTRTIKQLLCAHTHARTKKENIYHVHAIVCIQLCEFKRKLLIYVHTHARTKKEIIYHVHAIM